MPRPPCIVDARLIGDVVPTSSIYLPAWLRQHQPNAGMMIEGRVRTASKQQLADLVWDDPSSVAPHQVDVNAGAFAELRAAMDMLALRQDQLMDIIDNHFRSLADKLDSSVCMRKSSSKATMTTRASEGSTMSRQSSSQCDIACGPSAQSLDEEWHKRMAHYWAKTTDQLGNVSECLDVRRRTGCTVRDIVQAPAFEVLAGCIILVNLIGLFAQLQVQSCETAMSLGESLDHCGWQSASGWFEAAEHAFNVWCVLELALRIFAYRRQFLNDRVNLVDLSLVFMSFVNYASEHLTLPSIGPLRFLRALRAVRVVRVVRLLVVCGELNILLKTLAASLESWVWSMCLIGSIVWACGLLIMQLLNPFITDPTQDVDIRQALYLHFGTPLRAVYSMFVATFSAGWVPMASTMMEHVSPYFGFFWALYISLVNFAVIRVVAALFLKQTMNVAQHDQERRAMEAQKERKRYAKTLHEIFVLWDTSGDGKLSKDEFSRMIVDKDVWKMFTSLELDLDEVTALFDMMSGDDGFADYQELLTGALKMKRSARTFDVIQIMHELCTLVKRVQSVQDWLGICEPEYQEEDGNTSLVAVATDA